jgi:hypothetical protein
MWQQWSWLDIFVGIALAYAGVVCLVKLIWNFREAITSEIRRQVKEHRSTPRSEEKRP